MTPKLQLRPILPPDLAGLRMGQFDSERHYLAYLIRRSFTMPLFEGMYTKAGEAVVAFQRNTSLLIDTNRSAMDLPYSGKAVSSRADAPDVDHPATVGVLFHLLEVLVDTSRPDILITSSIRYDYDEGRIMYEVGVSWGLPFPSRVCKHASLGKALLGLITTLVQDFNHVVPGEIPVPDEGESTP